MTSEDCRLCNWIKLVLEDGDHELNDVRDAVRHLDNLHEEIFELAMGENL
jgi:hypothetical protein